MSQIIPLRRFTEETEISQQPEPLRDAQIRIIALRIYETVHGTRSITQLSRFVSPHIINKLEIQKALRTERATLYAKNLRVVPIPGRVTRSQVTDHKIYCVVVLHTTGRSYALTMCFEHFRVGWRVILANLM